MSITKDISIFTDPGNSSDYIHSIGSDSIIITGKNKVAQQFVQELMTSKESVTFDPDKGTSFVDNLQQIATLSDFDLYVLFNQSVHEALSNIQNKYDADTDLSEKINAVNLTKISISNSSTDLEILITTEDNSTTTVVVPLTFDQFATDAS